MQVLMINGSPRPKGNTARALQEMEAIFASEGIITTSLAIGNKAIRGCLGCYRCTKTGHCIFDDEVNTAADLLKDCEGLVVATPVYYASANGTVITFLDRLFTCISYDLTMKVGAGVAIARRGGCSATYDELNKYFGIRSMPIATSRYWNSVHGNAPGEASRDAEGLFVLRRLAKNMVFLMKSIELGRERYGLPPEEPRVATNFIRNDL